MLASSSPHATLHPDISSSTDRLDVVIFSPNEILILELTDCHNATLSFNVAQKRKDKYDSLVTDLEKRGLLCASRNWFTQTLL